jgi:HPt (histidine-containing phosphotransfer) domain-containing protein
MSPSSVQLKFAPPQDCEPDGTIAKRPAAGPTSRLLRVFIHQRSARGHLDDETGVPPDAPDLSIEREPDWILDAERLEELSSTMSPEELREFVWLSIVDTELRLTDIASHRAAGRWQALAQAARGIAGDAAYLGARRVHILALRLETACRSGEVGYGLIGELSQAWSQVGDHLCAWLAEQASSPAA